MCSSNELLLRVFAALFGGFLGLSLVKFGNPPIMEKWVTSPGGFLELLLGTPWPIGWAYWLLGLVSGVGVLTAHWNQAVLFSPSARRPAQTATKHSERYGAAAPRAAKRMASSPSTAIESKEPRQDGLISPRLASERGEGESQPAAPRWLIALPLIWLGWQLLAGIRTLDDQLTTSTLKHFTACAACFYLGFFSLSRVKRLQPFWAGLLGGLFLVLASGFMQHFGGLEETRRYFFLNYVYLHPQEVPPEYLKRLSSTRIFATLFYPNALAGCLLLLLPVVLTVIWRSGRFFTTAARGLLMGLAGVAGLACLSWSGSKGGWLLTLLLALAVLLRLPLRKQLKITVVCAVLLAGLVGFFWKYSAFFQKGATSVGARLDYWRAAVQTARDNPIFGTGPGTFAIPYQKLKRPDAEMSRLVHNDYLEQASDSGLIGSLAYTVFITGGLMWSYPKARSSARAEKLVDRLPRPGNSSSGASDDYVDGPKDETGLRTPVPSPDNWLPFSVWLGLLGWSCQGLLEFGLYIPALAWPAFALLGWLLGSKASAHG